jgi:hypothetical protein
MRALAGFWIAAALAAGSGRYELGANSGNDGGVFVLDSRTGVARFFNAEGVRAGRNLAFDPQSKEEEPGTYRLSVNSGALGGAWILHSKSGAAKYFNIRRGQVGPNFRFEESDKPGSVGAYAICANSGDQGGAYLMDTRTGLVRMFAFEGDRIGKEIRFDAALKAPQEVGRFALDANAGAPGGVFVLDTRTGLCRFFHKDGAQFGKDIRFDAGAPPDAKPGRFSLSVNSGPAGGVFLLDTRAGVCRYFRVDGSQFGRDIRFPAENPERSTEGRFAVAANSGEAAGLFLCDSLTGLVRYYHVVKGEPFGKEIKFPDSPVFHKEAGRFLISANSGGWGGVYVQDSESGVVRRFQVDGTQAGPDIKE